MPRTSWFPIRVGSSSLVPSCIGSSAPPSPPALPPLERGRLLAGERRHAAPEVVGAAAGGDRLRLQLHLRLEALPRRLMEEPLGAAEGLRRPLRQLARQRRDGGGQLGVGHHAGDETPFERLARRRPMSRGRKYDDDPSGVAAILEYAIVKRADSAATTTSPESAKLSPPPAATPFTAMMTGLSLRQNRETAPCRYVVSSLTRAPMRSRLSTKSLTSPPAQNARPAPRSSVR